MAQTDVSISEVVEASAYFNYISKCVFTGRNPDDVMAVLNGSRTYDRVNGTGACMELTPRLVELAPRPAIHAFMCSLPAIWARVPEVLLVNILKARIEHEQSMAPAVVLMNRAAVEDALQKSIANGRLFIVMTLLTMPYVNVAEPTTDADVKAADRLAGVLGE